MSGILHALEQNKENMNRQEQALASYIVEHAHEVVSMGITELAERSQTSPATISRFCKSLHFQGFTDFKLKLSGELAKQPSEHSYQDIVAGNPLSEIVSAIEANHLRSIADTTQLNDIKQLQQAVSALKNARQIDLYGVATSGIVAQDFYQKLVRIGKRTSVFSDPHMQITSASNLGKNDVVFAISYSGDTEETIQALRCAKERGAVTISLTKFGTNPLANLSDIRLFASTLEEGMRRGDMASRIAQLHVIDILFTSLVSEEFDELIPRLERSYQLVRKYRNKGRE
ncbi:transcriptional regulator, RpiR family [Paenibacillus larvae subsp. larvae]|uniref:Transcriptional regulator, RpiR family n=1 Tax=Paenibacillus larvae subsp. larvae TaxID=147375 RepID=A0A2L1TWZ7_9BACL|nr:MurR/RpiR family transcriptional regulator [Paenibacillus larvae]AQT86883.1 transcriptional regulator [Paenibacillus larvae subsp. pulvifaciens]AQZ49000.1 transcriptional regulator [Paenibacillus larvae subsp. pulvifaciens]AVF25203.1 transcriptional regulator, RpiR family [Paenibacillus larvae subsp. larvae]AVF29980.1 transcriptional regulator, RpiR family [Paenibacillus larvae subsp. larvae]MBH0341056.1 transcriptional regulator [Paenibacillus larvae]